MHRYHTCLPVRDAINLQQTLKAVTNHAIRSARRTANNTAPERLGRRCKQRCRNRGAHFNLQRFMIDKNSDRRAYFMHALKH